MSVYRLLTVMAAAAVIPVTASKASAETVYAAPSGPGTEARPASRYHSEHIVEGFQGAVQLGSGFSDPYGLGLGARLGYTFWHGVYLGGAVTHYFGNTVDTPEGTESAHATFVGAELGYEFYPNYHWEIRPYVFLGPSWITTIDPNTLFVQSRTDLAVQPGLLVAYHFGNVFLSGEGKIHATPDPTALTLFAGAGIGFD
jgi:hypothetical protein